ncbi:hypothetical protein QOT17_024522 [Balamuthia mandrillaris]
MYCSKEKREGAALGNEGLVAFTEFLLSLHEENNVEDAYPLEMEVSLALHPVVTENIVRLLTPFLSVKDLVMLAGVNSSFRRWALSAPVWRPHVLPRLQLFPDSIALLWGYSNTEKRLRYERKEKKVTWVDVYRKLYRWPQVGMVFEVKDTYEFWSVARVHARLGENLFLIHYEGWSEAWTVWYHKYHDRAIIRALTKECPGIGGAGSYKNEEDWQSYHAQVLNRLVTDAEKDPTTGYLTSHWIAPTARTGIQQSYPYHEQETQFTCVIQDEAKWLKQQKAKPFRACHTVVVENCIQ